MAMTSRVRRSLLSPLTHRSRLGVLSAVVALLPIGFAAEAHEWPRLPLPDSARTFDIGSDVQVNGLPVQVHGFVAAARPEAIAQWFRERLGQPLLENRLDHRLILGRRQGDHYLTVQLEAAGTGTRGLVGMTRLAAAHEPSRDSRSDAERWIARWPAGSRLLSRVVSQERGRESQHFVVVNTHGEAVNAEGLRSLLAADGFGFEREATPAEAQLAGLPQRLASSRALFFKGNGKEATATIQRDRLGRTAIVLNTLTRIEGDR